MFNSIKTKKDVEFFLDKTNSLHDGFIVGVQYENKGISVKDDEYKFTPQTKLILRIMVTSISDTIVELEFENLLEWQIKDFQGGDIADTTIIFDQNNYIVWADDDCEDVDEMKDCSYVVAQFMKWRVV